MKDDDKAWEYENTGSSIAFTNTKGYYLLLDRIMTFIAMSRLENNYDDWLEGLDTLASYTKTYFSSKEDINLFNEKYLNIRKNTGNTEKYLSSNVKKSLNHITHLKIRELHELLFKNISHLMLKTDSNDEDDLPDWIRDD